MISCADVVSVYEMAGYSVFHKDCQGEAYNCYIQAEDSDSGEYILFHFFDTAQQAESYADDSKWNVVLWLYSLACGEPTWITVKTCGNVEVEYGSGALYQPFGMLISG